MRQTAFVLLLVAGCGGDQAIPAAQFGARLFDDEKLSTSPFNAFACRTCHTVEAGAPFVVQERLDSGYNLADTVGRPSWWGSYQTTLLDAINTCLESFMGGRRLSADDDQARALYAYLDAGSPTPQVAALPLTIVRDVAAPPTSTGEARRGSQVWAAACRRCHGAAHTGAGRLTSKASIVPGSSITQFGAQAAAVAVVEKIRHGRFFNIGGVMPFYSAEAMTDQQVADLLVYLRLR